MDGTNTNNFSKFVIHVPPVLFEHPPGLTTSSTLNMYLPRTLTLWYLCRVKQKITKLVIRIMGIKTIPCAALQNVELILSECFYMAESDQQEPCLIRFRSKYV